MSDAAKNAPPAGGAPKPGPAVVKVMPQAQQAGLRRRHGRLLLSFAVLVILPLLVTVSYLWIVAEDQYASTTGFTVRREEGGGATDFLGNLGQFTGGSGASDADILYEFIQSQGLVEAIDDQLNLRAIYSVNWEGDPLFSLWPDAPIEDLLWYWQRMVRISYDQGTGLIELRVLAFDPQTAQIIAEAIVAESQKMINALNEAAREDLMRNAVVELDEAVARLRTAREALTQFRTVTQIVDPNADLQGQVGVINNLQQKLAEALIEYDERLQANATDPRLEQLQRTVDIIRARIDQERESIAQQEVASVGKDYPTLLSEYEGLVVDREYAETAYRASLTALDAARAKIARQSRYLAAYVEPTLPQSAEYPKRFVLSSLTALFLVMAWSICALIYYSLRDRR
ncbi:hypothetical protein [Ponticoccus alexandrii]|uniref:hypothetical protein n=1 Tax=Ponticoccus alexandrii TaxID=1943633 RepID=UPI0003D1B275|nr:hypothetical protein [Ponticoccus alexandrii]